ncbi:hypothetical protein TNCV_2383731 [Trichonephila clavipes]|nr:hypothetical protein TNCV_2383731 [Trichonephila clavipes]
MSTPVPWPAALDYASEFAGQRMVNSSSMLFKRRTYTSSGKTLRIVLLVDAIILRKNNAYIGVDMSGPLSYNGIRVFAFRGFKAVNASVYLFDGAENVIHRKTLSVATQWTSNCGAGVQIPAFVVDEQQPV